jgi:pimeloyl-ACP methyl ester carboxylesterase
VLCGGFARGARRLGSAKLIEQSDPFLTLMRAGWGQENPAFRQLFTTRLMPDGTPEQTRAFNELQRRTCSPEVAAALVSAMLEIDVSLLLPQLAVPTLVLHCRDDAMIPFEQGRQLAAAIPGSRFVALESRNHILLEGDPAYARFLEEMSSSSMNDDTAPTSGLGTRPGRVTRWASATRSRRPKREQSTHYLDHGIFAHC